MAVDFALPTASKALEISPNPTVDPFHPLNPSVDPFHPLYLHPSDTPRTILVSVPFTGIGYGEWREGMIIYLSTKNKLQLKNGFFTKHDSNSMLYPQWERYNNMVKSWIMNVLSRKYLKLSYITK